MLQGGRLEGVRLVKGMKTLLSGWAAVAIAVAAVVGVLAGAAAPALALPAQVQAVPGDVIVAYSADVPAANAGGIRGLMGAYDVEESDDLGISLDGASNVVRLTLADDDAVDSLIDELSNTDGVLFAQRNYRYQLMDGWEGEQGGGFASSISLLPENLQPADLLPEACTARSLPAVVNDPSFSQQWYLGTWEDDHGADVCNAWDMAKAEGGVTVAVLDTGVRKTHKDLVSNLDLAHAKDVFNDSAPGTIYDCVGHGTHVCGIVAASANNGIGIAGASYNAKVLPIKVFDDSTSANAYTETSYLVKGYAYLQNLVASGEVPDLHVVNMSVGGYGEQDSADIALQSAIKTLRDNYQVLTVCAGGNGDKYGNPLADYSWPGDYEECLSVTALDGDGGNARWSDYNDAKDISAPGVSLYSTYNRGDDSYKTMSGTSMASPLVAGIASLLWAAQPNLTVDQAVKAIETTANDIVRDANFHEESGSAGAIDAEAALRYVLDEAPDGRVDIGDAQFAMDEVVAWTGGAVKPQVAGIYGDTPLVEGVDFAVSYSSNVNVGTARAVVSGLGKFRGVVRKSFRICYDLSDGTAWAADIPAQSYTGEELALAVEVHYGSNLLQEGSDYTVSYRDNVAGPVGVATVTGMGSYMGSLETTFAIKGAPGAYVIERLAGTEARDTAAVISARAFAQSDVVVLARDDDFADAMSATGLAGVFSCPIVLTDRYALSAVAADEISRLGAKTVYVIGGPAAMPGDFEGKLRALGVANVARVFGDDAWDTSVACANVIAANGGGNDAIVAMSRNFQDALSISSFAYRYKLPIFLETDRGDCPLPQAAIDAIAGMSGNIYVPGGPGAVKPSTVEEVFPGRTVVRMFGEDGFDTSNQVARMLTGAGLLHADTACVASGRAAACGLDALAGSALAGARGGVMLLVDGTKDAPLLETTTVIGPDSTGEQGFLQANVSEVRTVFVLGGNAVVPPAMVDLIDKTLAQS